LGKVLEHHSKQLIGEQGVPVPRHWVVTAGEAAESVFREHFQGKGAVLKALVPVGKRGKAGAVKFAFSAEEAKAAAKELLSMTVRHFPVEQVLMEERIDIQEEWYVSITIDKNKQLPVIIASTDGGVEVEDLVRDKPDQVSMMYVDPFRGLQPYQSKQMWSGLGLSGSVLNQATGILCKLYAMFIQYDAYILEINPLVLTKDGKVMAAASVLGIDDAAMYRHPELNGKVEAGTERSWRPLTELEKQMMAVNDADYRGTARYTEMDGGDIGFMCGGGGGSLLSFDALVKYGGRPANYSETGGNPSEEKVHALTKGILSKPGVKGLFVAHNITNNTQIDVMARGIVKAVKELRIDPAVFPIVVREAGVNDAEGKRIFEAIGITYFGDEVTIEQAAQKMMERMKEVYHGNFN
jgi:succinyl-CoA synthetase beta subunit/citryl-CoA synthetase large subunit